MKQLISGGRIVDPANSVDREADLLIENDRIAGIFARGTAAGDETVDATGLVITPGLIDIHVHLREPGFEYKEDIESGTQCAAAGGFTQVCCMPNTNPAIDSPSVVRHIIQRAAEVGNARVLPIAAATRGMDGDQLTDMAELRDCGAIAVSDDAFPIQSAAVMRHVMEYCTMLGLPLMTHNEDKALTYRGCMNEGKISSILGLQGMPRAAEDIATARNILLARLTGCRLHLLHISTAGTVGLLREAKAQGLPVTGEACPHHWTLTDEACESYNTDAKMNPPLRTPEDCEAIRAGLADGTIDCISTDHAPHARHEKCVEFEAAPFGILGLETAFPLVYTTLVRAGVLTLSNAVACMSLKPARILSLPGGAGTLSPGALADVAAFELDTEYALDREASRSRSRNTPYHGTRLFGQTRFTILGGRLIRN